MRRFAIAVNKTNNPALIELTFYEENGEKGKYIVSFGDKFVGGKIKQEWA